MSEHTEGNEYYTGQKQKRDSKAKSLGTVNDQKFYSIRVEPEGGKFDLPFTSPHFNALVEISVPVTEAVMRSVGLNLLRKGARHILTHGENSSRFAEIIDELVEEFDFSHEGLTVFASDHDDEPLEELIEYFSLPDDLADTNLFVVIGGESAFRRVTHCFAHVTGNQREQIFAAAV